MPETFAQSFRKSIPYGVVLAILAFIGEPGYYAGYRLFFLPIAAIFLGGVIAAFRFGWLRLRKK